jgi:hypothetical protein
MIEASKRGVNCVLMIDDLNQRVDRSLKEEFEKCGGLFYSLNPVSRFWNIITKTFFRRHHEKVTLVDDWVSVGSSNITDDYSGILINEMSTPNSFPIYSSRLEIWTLLFLGLECFHEEHVSLLHKKHLRNLRQPV